MSNGQQNLNRTVRKSFVGGFITGSFAFVGGLVGGPVGLGIGATVGGIISSTMLRFRSAPQVMQNDFTPNERRELMDRVGFTLTETKEFIVNILLQMLSQLQNCKTLQDFKCRILLPILEDLIGLGVGHLIRCLFTALAA